jgi:PPOX class probable F420-dependent enzyme
MRLTEAEALARLGEHDHGVLCTVHAERGVDAVPVVYVVNGDGQVGVPVDLVKPKLALRLQRERNLEVDPRATLLIDHWDRDDWARLWWVRAELRWERDVADTTESLFTELLSRKYRQYHDRPFVRILVFRIVSVSGWSGSDMSA